MKTKIVNLLAKKRASKAQGISITGFQEAHGKYSEAYGMGVEFALLSPENEVIHQFTYCKDFIADVYYGFHLKKTAQIYGFTWTPEKNKNPSISPAKILVRDKKLDNCPDRCKNTEKLLNIFEKALGIETPSRCIWLEKQKCMYVESSEEWVSFPAMISLWTLTIRVGFRYYNHDEVVGKKRKITLKDILSKVLLTENLKSCPAGDSYKIKSVIGILSHLEDGLYKKSLENKTFQSYENNGIHTYHNNAGIVTVAGELKNKKEPTK